MSGSGNDFVMVDARQTPPGDLQDPETIQRVCARGTGVGADGIVFLLPSSTADLRLLYLNSDGSEADLCGNATLCTTRLAARLGAAKASGMSIETGAGVLSSRLLADGTPEVDLQEVTDIRPEAAGIDLEGAERRIGFATAGIPHLVIEVPDVAAVGVVGRGRPLRSHPTLWPHGANVNFISHDGSRWRMRTYERGVEGETLACGTGAVASAILVRTWNPGTDPVELSTRSGRTLRVRLTKTERGFRPSLAGEARFVFEGTFGEL